MWLDSPKTYVIGYLLLATSRIGNIEKCTKFLSQGLRLAEDQKDDPFFKQMKLLLLGNYCLLSLSLAKVKESKEILAILKSFFEENRPLFSDIEEIEIKRLEAYLLQLLNKNFQEKWKEIRREAKNPFHQSLALLQLFQSAIHKDPNSQELMALEIELTRLCESQPDLKAIHLARLILLAIESLKCADRSKLMDRLMSIMEEAKQVNDPLMTVMTLMMIAHSYHLLQDDRAEKAANRAKDLLVEKVGNPFLGTVIGSVLQDIYRRSQNQQNLNSNLVFLTENQRRVTEAKINHD